MPMTNAFANMIGDYAIGETDVDAMVDTYLALLLGNPGDGGSVLQEVTGSGYARQLLTGSMSAFSGKVSTNTGVIDFGSPGSDWGTIPYVGVMTDVTAGEMWFYEQLPTPRLAASGGRPVKFEIGKLTIRLI